MTQTVKEQFSKSFGSMAHKLSSFLMAQIAKAGMLTGLQSAASLPLHLCSLACVMVAVPEQIAGGLMGWWL